MVTSELLDAYRTALPAMTLNDTQVDVIYSANLFKMPLLILARLHVFCCHDARSACGGSVACKLYRGRPEYHVWGSLSPGHGEHGSASVCGLSNRVCGQSPAGSRGRAPSQGVRGAKPPEAENLLASGCATEAANLPHSVRT